MIAEELKKQIKELEIEVKIGTSAVNQMREALRGFKMELAEISISDLIGKHFERLVEKEDDRYQEDYTEYIKILALKDDRQVYIESFALEKIKYHKPRKIFNFIVNSDIYVQFLDEFDYKEITEVEYKKALKECLEEVGVLECSKL